MPNETEKIADYDGRYNQLLNISLPQLEIVQSHGLKTHIEKRHAACVKYIDKIPEIIASPDYVGVNPKEEKSFELVKVYDDNVLLGIKLDVKNGRYYVATLHEISQSKLDRRVFSGRLKKL